MSKRDDLNAAVDRLVTSTGGYATAATAKLAEVKTQLTTAVADATAAAAAAAADDPALDTMIAKATAAADQVDGMIAALNAPA